VSLGLELLQLAVPVRCASVDDLLFNTLGGGCGVVLGRLGGRAPRPA
jgi:glycopeptide antibiotics resistance protein